MRVDTDRHIQQNNTYRYAMGGRLAWNRSNDRNKSFEENIKSGNSLAFVVARGNRYELSICPGYKVIGSIDTLKGTVIFSTNNVNSEIGWLELNDNINAPNHAKYFTRFNDRNDPNGDKLNFKEQYFITGGFAVYENEFTHRIYWTDGYNQKRSLNLTLFFKENGEPYHPDNAVCDAQVTYPKWLSAHAFDERMDVVPAKVKFRRRIKGQCKSGVYQIVYRYVSKTGHTSVWSDLSRYVFVTDQKLDGDINVGGTNYPNAYKSNHHNRTMGASNIMTEEGMRWELKGVDTRWDQVEVGFVYHTTSVAFQEAISYKKIDITGSSVIVDIVGHTGTSISKAELNQRYETALSVGTTAEQENRTWDGNIELLPDLTLNLSGVKIEPTVRYYRPDNTVEPTFEPVFNPVSGRNDNDPITNSSVVTKNVSIQNFEGDVEDYEIFDDYENYKGQQFNHLFKGYFRGETQPFAFLWIDRKGNPLFAQHIGDFTFPQQFDTEDADGNPTDWTLSRQNVDGSFDLRIMGVKVSNIVIPRDLIYDKFGKLNVSGFKIVRTERVGRIKNQGILVNCNHSPNEQTDTETDGFIHPMEGLINAYGMKPLNVVLPNSHVFNGLLGSMYRRERNSDHPYPAFSAAGFFNYHSPDILIEQKIPETFLKDQIEKVGFVHKAYSENLDLFSDHYYTKAYKTRPLEWASEIERVKNGRGKLGSKSRIKLGLIHDKPTTYTYENFDPDVADKYDYRPNVQAFFPGEQYAWKSSLQPYAAILKLLDWKLIDSVESDTSRVTYPIVNWKTTPDGYYSQEEGSLEKRRYFSTGHLQPITEAILAKVKKNYNPNGSVKEYVFDGIEIWGGDCYNTLFDFTRMYPYYLNCEKSDNKYPDYSTSMICPIESKYNLSLIFGRKFAANAVMPQRTSCTGEEEHMSNGIMLTQTEDWSYNEVLNLQENTKFYFPQPADVKFVQRKENGIWWSPIKLYGSKEDSYRQRLVDDFSEITGQYGKVQKFLQAYNSLYVLQESAFGQMRTELRTVIPTENGEELSIQSGSVFGGVNYISKTFGTQHVNSSWAFNNQLGFVDAHMGKLLVFSQNGLQPESDEKQLSDPITEMSIYFDQDIVHDQDGGVFVDIVAGVDSANNEVLTTLHFQKPQQIITNPDDRSNELRSKTIMYNLSSRSFHSWQPFTPTIYIQSGRYLLCPDNSGTKGNQLFLQNHGKYGQWFGKYYDTILEFIVDESPNISKVFDNGSVNTEFNNYQRLARAHHTTETDEQIVIFVVNNGTSLIRPDDRTTFEESRLVYPIMEQDEWAEVEQRLRGHYMIVKLVIDNSQQAIDGQDLGFSITNYDTQYRISYPIQYKN